jgi:predicted naringenin-chalcone synthase
MTATADGAGFDPALLKPSQQILAQYGNMSSPTIAFILERLQQAGAPTPCVALAFGPGLTFEAGLFV